MSHRSCFYTSVSADGTTKELSEPILTRQKFTANNTGEQNEII